MPTPTEAAAREAICRLGASLFARGLTFGELFLMFDRSNFRFDAVLELSDHRSHEAPWPSVLVLRARAGVPLPK